MAITTLALNFKNMASSQFFGFLANSAGTFNGKLYFASDAGIHVFDETSDEEEVAAYFVLPVSDYQYIGQKTPRSILFSGRFDGTIKASVTDENGITKDYLSQNMSGASGCKIALDSDQRSRYFKIKVSNVEGSYFSIDAIDLVHIPGPEPRR